MNLNITTLRDYKTHASPIKVFTEYNENYWINFFSLNFILEQNKAWKLRQKRSLRTNLWT